MPPPSPASSHLPSSVVVPGWPRPAGFAHGMSARGRVISLAGQIGSSPETGTVASDDLAEQAGQALRNIVAVLSSAGATPAHLVRLTWFIVDRDAYVAARRAIGEHYRTVIGRHYPAMSVIFVTALLEPRARVEIEATAIVPD